MTRDTDLPTGLLSGLFLASGTLHLVRPRTFEPIIPGPLREHDRALVRASGVAEVACGAGLLVPATRPLAGASSVALLAAVFPANVQMSIDAVRRAQRRRTPKSLGLLAGTVARLPLQWPMIRTAARAAGWGRRGPA
ncbi:DoxX family protein [Janibacter corallicola]|uniref:DoxX family protein n=1 Tax=Janibacter corallicola TaxID=415212 RepID=UPI00083264EE|nr:MauE/DoxX family redox-associated membrane protein [Janibacter corallicola]